MEITIQEAIESIVAGIPGAPLHETVDVIKVGNPQQNLTGIVVTFMAT